MTNPNDPAFPVDPETQRYQKTGAWLLGGLTKREYFVGQAIRGAIEWHGYHEDPRRVNLESIAKDCIAMADTLIAELSKEPK